MITLVPGTLRGPAAVGARVDVTTPAGVEPAQVWADAGTVIPGDGVLLARARFDVGITRRDVAILLGPWPVGAPDPVGPEGLAATPVVVLPDQVWTDLAEGGARRSGRCPATVRIPADLPAIGLQMLIAVNDGAEVILIEGGGASHLRIARALGGRPLPALPIPDADALRALFEGCDVDVNVPIPAAEGSTRERIYELVSSLALEGGHHPVEVDPAPAFAEAELDVSEASLEALAAGAAGVLAGRMAAANRRWRSDAET